MSIRHVKVIDSHTGGEPTRVVLTGGPVLGAGSLADRLIVFRENFDTYRSAIVNEPRGSDAMVGALLCQPVDPSCATGVIFFNNVGYLGMCGHGTIGVIVTLAHLGIIGPGTHKMETPVGLIEATLDDPNTVTLRNVPSFRLAASVAVAVEGLGVIRGDIAWGGNWFFLVNDHAEYLHLSNIDRLIDVTWKIRQALIRQKITGTNGQEIDHIELFSPSSTTRADSRNFVLCPGKAYDRSPCGTGTSAKIACLFADGKIATGVWYRQESIIGSFFEARVTLKGDQIIPEIRGTAFINAEADLILNDDDSFGMGIRA